MTYANKSTQNRITNHTVYNILRLCKYTDGDDAQMKNVLCLVNARIKPDLLNENQTEMLEHTKNTRQHHQRNNNKKINNFVWSVGLSDYTFNKSKQVYYY